MPASAKCLCSLDCVRGVQRVNLNPLQIVFDLFVFCLPLRYALTSIRVPNPVMSVALIPKAADNQAAFARALQRFQKEDPTFKV
jgi:translation elongation factor EF-G